MEIDVDLHMVPIAEANQRYISSVGTADKLCDKTVRKMAKILNGNFEAAIHMGNHFQWVRDEIMENLFWVKHILVAYDKAYHALKVRIIGCQ